MASTTAKKDDAQLPATAKSQLPAGLDADMAAELDQYEGAGVSKSADDKAIPFLALLQDMSPEAKKRDPSYVEGAEPGFLLNKLTRTLWGPDDECVVIPCAYARYVMEWVPRNKGGGYVARHELQGSFENTAARLGAKSVADPEDEKKIRWVMPNGNELIDTRYFYCILENDGGSPSPVVMAFSSTGHKTAKAWMSIMDRPLPGTTRKPPAWWRRYRAVVRGITNAKGDFFTLEMKELGLVMDRGLRDMGRQFYEAFEAGGVRAAEEPHSAPAEDDSGI